LSARCNGKAFRDQKTQALIDLVMIEAPNNATPSRKAGTSKVQLMPRPSFAQPPYTSEIITDPLVRRNFDDMRDDVVHVADPSRKAR